MDEYVLDVLLLNLEAGESLSKYTLILDEKFKLMANLTAKAPMS
jgi:hypothetical protein